MNAQELFTSEAKATGIFFCSKCRVVHRDRDGANKCCQPTLCQDCGVEIFQYYTKCNACLEMKQLEAAQETEDWCGMFVGEKFFSDEDSLVEYLSDVDEVEDIDDFPNYAFAATANVIPKLIAQDLVFNVIETDVHEDFDVEDLEGLAELQRGLDVFVNENASTVLSYEMDTSKKVNLARYKAEAKRLFVERKEEL